MKQANDARKEGNEVILMVYISLLIAQVGQLNSSSISDLNYDIENLNLTNTEEFMTDVAHQKEDLIHRFQVFNSFEGILFITSKHLNFILKQQKIVLTANQGNFHIWIDITKS